MLEVKVAKLLKHNIITKQKYKVEILFIIIFKVLHVSTTLTLT